MPPTKLPIKLLAIDLDHTLIEFGLVPISPFNRQMIQAAQKQCEVVIATGRSFERSLNYAQQLKLRYHVCFGGALTYDLHSQTFISVQTIAQTALQIIAQTVLNNPDLFAVFYAFDVQQHKIINFTLNQSNAAFRFHRIATTGFRRFTPEVLELQIVRVNIFTAKPPLLHQILQKLTALKTLQISKNYNNVLEITATNGHKGAAIARLTRQLGISAHQTMAIVDSLNDYTLVQFVKYAVAVANAHPLIQKLCSHQTAAFDQDGVGHAIQKLLLN